VWGSACSADPGGRDCSPGRSECLHAARDVSEVTRHVRLAGVRECVVWVEGAAVVSG
jgi:hypothetical protein